MKKKEERNINQESLYMSLVELENNYLEKFL